MSVVKSDLSMRVPVSLLGSTSATNDALPVLLQGDLLFGCGGISCPRSGTLRQRTCNSSQSAEIG